MTAHDHLNYRQVGEYVQRANAGGGFTVKAYGPNAGTEGADKYMVGIKAPAPHGGLDIHPAEVGGDVEATTEQGMSFIEQRRHRLSEDNAYWGGWHGPDRISFDVSHGFNRTPGGLSKARHAAVHNDQEEIGELNTSGGYAGGHVNPFYGKTPSAESRAWQYEPIKKRWPGGMVQKRRVEAQSRG